MFLFPIFLWGVEIEFTTIQTQYIPLENQTQKAYYLLSSELHIKHLNKKNNKYFFLNRKRYMLENNYYVNGNLKGKNYRLTFKKAFILFGKIYLYEVQGSINNQKIQAKEIVYDGNKNFHLKKCEVKSVFKILRRKTYNIKIR